MGGNEPVVVEPVVNRQKVLDLLAIQTESPELDYKELYDLRRESSLRKRHQVELAKHVGAMSARGGYLVVGVNDEAVPTGALSEEQAAFFDEARLRPMLLHWLPDSLEIRSQRHKIDGNIVVLIYVAPNPAGFAMFKADGQYTDGKKATTVFSEGDIFFRDGTQSRKLTGRGLELIITRARQAPAPPPLPRVRSVLPYHAGIHRELPSAAKSRQDFAVLSRQRLTTYVPRDHDPILRTQLDDVAERGSGLVILIGRSCSGKTRSAWEGVQEQFPDWAFADFRSHAIRADLVRQPPAADTVVWLDDLQHYADPSALAADLRQVFSSTGPGHRIVAVATSWPRPAWEVGRSSHVLDRPERDDLLMVAQLAADELIWVEEDWETAEREIALQLAATEPRLQMALSSTRFTPTQVLGGARWLFDLWERPVHRTTQALLTAAIDLSRLGFDVLPEDLLRTCTPCYLRSGVPIRPGQFEEALNEAASTIRDIVSALDPIIEPHTEHITGYRLTDLLRDYGGQRRAWQPVPEAAWKALAQALLSRATLLRLASKARSRLLYQIADTLEARAYARRSTIGFPQPEQSIQVPVLHIPGSSISPLSARSLADQYYHEQNLSALQKLALPSRDGYVRRRLALLLIRLGDEPALLDLAVLSRKAARELITWLAAQGRVTDLLRQIVCGNEFGARALRDGWHVEGLTEAERSRILQRGLNPDGTIA